MLSLVIPACIASLVRFCRDSGTSSLASTSLKCTSVALCPASLNFCGDGATALPTTTLELRRVGEQSFQSHKVPGENPVWDCSFSYQVHRVDTVLGASRPSTDAKLLPQPAPAGAASLRSASFARDGSRTTWWASWRSLFWTSRSGPGIPSAAC